MDLNDIEGNRALHNHRPVDSRIQHVRLHCSLVSSVLLASANL